MESDKSRVSNLKRFRQTVQNDGVVDRRSVKSGTEIQEKEREQGDMAKRLAIRVEFPEPGLKRKNCQSSGAVEQGYISEFAGNNNAK